MKQWRGGSAIKKRPTTHRRRGQDGQLCMTLEEFDASMTVTLGLKERDAARLRSIYAAVKQRPQKGRKGR